MSMKEAVFGGTVKGGNTGGRQFAGSSQAWLPIKNVINGVVVTRDNRFIKIVVGIRLLVSAVQSACTSVDFDYLLF